MKPTFKIFCSRLACLIIRQCIYCLLLSLSSFPLYSQSKLSGIVQDSEGKAVPFANILLLWAKDSSLVKRTVAGEAGNYQLENVEVGHYLLAASVVGYRKGYSASFTILTGSDHIKQPALVLQVELQQLEEVSVTAQKPLFEQHMGRLVVNVQSSIIAAGSTALDILERSPGISINRQNSSLSMNGKEGVMVMVNGKISRLPLSAVIQMLSGMNAANIEKIELITTPPAQFDAEGNAGIINIVLKNNPDYGTSGSYSFNAGYGFFEKGGFDFTLNKRTSRLNLFANTSLLWNHFWIQFKNKRVVTHEEGLTETSMVSTRPSYRYVYNFRLGFDYKLTQKTIIGGMVIGFENRTEQFAHNTTAVIADHQLVTSLLIEDHEKNNWTHGMGNVMVRHAFAKDHQISLDLDYLRYYHYNPHSYSNTYQQVEANSAPIDKIESHMQVPIHLWVAKADYSKPIGKASKLEAGLKTTISRLNNKVNLKRLQAGTWHTDREFTQSYQMLEDIEAAYANFYHQINLKTKLQAGLRYEYTHTHLHNLNQRDLVKRRYGNFFPSLFVSRDLGKENNLQFSFSRRLSRPTYSDLASVFTYFDPYTLLIGNSSLRPAYTNTLQAIYGYKKSYLFTLGYSQQRNAIHWLVKIDPVANTQITYKDNLTKLNTLFLSLSIPIQVSSWWQMQHHLIAGWQRSIMDYEAKTIYNHRSYGQVNTMHTFRLPADFSVEVSGMYHTPTLFGIAMQKALGTINVGIEKKLGKEKGKFQVSITDLLWTNRLHYHYINPSLHVNQSIGARFEPRVFRLTYSRSFGSKNIKPAEKRATGSEEERSRANN